MGDDMSTLLKLTLADFEQMVEEGAFNWLRDRRIELIYGEIRETRPRDVYLVIEVADSSYDSDVGEKVEIYAKADIKDY